jgi:hypothetical protein
MHDPLCSIGVQDGDSDTSVAVDRREQGVSQGRILLHFWNDKSFCLRINFFEYLQYFTYTTNGHEKTSPGRGNSCFPCRIM